MIFFLILFQVLFLRENVDKVGFSLKEEQVFKLIEASKKIRSFHKFKEKKEKPFGVICPHDDHLYAAPFYVESLKEIKAKNVLIFGVAHGAKKWGIKDKIILEDFDGFKTPKGYLKINKEIRSYIIKNLKENFFIICGDCHAEEHSIEGILPFLEYFDQDLKIIPILVPYMDFNKIKEISKNLSKVIFEFLKKNNLKPIEDLQIVISSDSVHYGDQGWGGKNYAPFGVDCKGLKKAIKRDIKISKKYLSNKIKEEKLKKFLYTIIKEENLEEYKIPWCGRFSITFGALFLKDLSSLFNKKIYGYPVAYGTSVKIGQILDEKNGLGTTAEANLHHWVGYLSLKFIIEKE